MGGKVGRSWSISMESKHRIAAGRIGVSVEEYSKRIDAGEKWCSDCQAFHKREEFGNDAGSYDGLMRSCRRSINQTNARRRGRPRSLSREEFVGALERALKKVHGPARAGFEALLEELR